LTPVGTPAISDPPEVGSGFGSVTSDHDAMIQRVTAVAAGGDDTTGVVLPAFRIDTDSSKQKKKT